MVDAAGAYLRKQQPLKQLSPFVHDSSDGALVHAQVCDGSCPTPAQHPDWVANWIAHSGTETIIAALHGEDGSTIFSLPLELCAFGAVKAARYLSGPHANGNFPALSAEAPAPDRSALELLIEQIATDRPDIDILVLERQAKKAGGVDNPLLQLPHAQSPNPALSVTLAGGFDAVLERSSGKRKRKKHRSQMRKFDAAGGWQRVRAETGDQARKMLDAFFAMKSERFRKLGIHNTFGDDGVKRFFHNLFGEAAQKTDPVFVLNGLEVGGTLRAITGSSLCAGRYVCEFSAFADDELAVAAPGDFLFYENIREACDNGAEIYDFSVGDEGYKRQWCDRVEWQFDCFIPLNAKGRLAAMAYRSSAEAKRIVKSNDTLWKAAKSIRRKIAGG